MLVMLVLLAADPGFGGVSEAPPCRVRVDGQWAACDAYLEQTKPQPPLAPKRSVEPGDAPPTAENPTPEAAADDGAVRTDTRRHTQTRTLRVLSPQGPLGDALRARTVEVKETPLSRLRASVHDLEVELETLQATLRKTRSDEDDARAAALADKKQALADATRLLNDVEVYALRLRQRCQDRLPETEDGERPFQSPKALTVGRRLDVTEPEVRAALALLDAPQCQRTALVAQRDIDDLARLQVVEAEIPNAQSYSDLARRRALEAELKELSLLRTGLGLSRPVRATKKRASELAPQRFQSNKTGYQTLGSAPAATE